MHAPSPSTLTLLALIPLLAWRIRARFRRMVGRQRLSRIRPWITLVLFPTLVLLIGLAARSQPERILWLAAGLVVGAALGVFGLSKTQFEPTKEGLFYTPNAHLGIALSLLFVARIAYRFVEIYRMGPGGPSGMGDFARSPLTLSVFGLLAGYYVSYAIGLVRWRWRVLAAKQAREAAQAAAAADAAAKAPSDAP
jgi:cytochrome b561